ncbi:MAG TPA: triose-phosphate isomerase [Syntrophales bacterium]|nr:triose-phosphate isomerase [Syntrophales bacterium]
MAVRKALIIGNWKMHKTVTEAVEFAQAFTAGFTALADRDVAIAPPFTALQALKTVLEDTPIALCAQNVHWEQEGAFTGEVSAPMLLDAGCRYALIGHSERRRWFGETNEDVNRKAKAALKTALLPVVCVGETVDEREADQTFSIIRRQLKEGLNNISSDDIRRAIVAYEPVWAIGTGKTAAPEQAEEVHDFIRQFIARIHGADIAAGIRILYGGSVNADNAGSLMAQKDIDGLLVGGASLDTGSFRKIIDY